MKRTLLVFVVLPFLSCGPSAEEKAKAEQIKIDSVAKYTEKATLLRIEREKEVADSIATYEKSVKDSIATYKESAKDLEANINLVSQQISDSRTQLRLAYEKLESIKEFEFGRTKGEKELQIAEQYEIIQGWEDYIKDLNKELERLEKSR